jgi:hypothetical protein
MQVLPTVLAIALLSAACHPAAAQQNQPPKPPPQRPPVIVNDPSLYRPPPPPHERTYVGPGPSVVAPMERVPQVAPLAQPPVR